MLLRELFLRIRITSDDAEYKAAQWPGLHDEYNAWTELLDNQVTFLSCASRITYSCRSVFTSCK